jgi:flagellar biosynthesis/type III secretory pathway M-ring protein FliF/YscJ
VEELEEEQKEKEVERKRAEAEAEKRLDPLSKARLEAHRDPTFTAHILKNWINQKG